MLPQEPKPKNPCRICGVEHEIPPNKACQNCWELENRIYRDPESARKILQRYDDAQVKLALARMKSGGH
jgi:hypothetical protein